MKKIALLLLLAASSLTLAQTHFGVKAGYSLSSMKWKSSIGDLKFDSKSYFYVGGFAEHKFNEKFAVQGEVIYTELGGQMEEELTQFVGNQLITVGMAEYKFKYPQIQVPVSAKYYFVNNFNVLGGFNLAFNINPVVKSNFLMNGSDEGKLENAKTLNISPFLGAEYLFDNHFSVDARYNFGLFNANNSGFDNRTGFLQIGLGYRFR